MKHEATESDYFLRLKQCLEQVRAEARLQEMRDAERNSFKCERFRRNRAAQVKGRCRQRSGG